MSTLGKAIKIAANAYVKRVDKAGQPRVLHSLAVMTHLHTEHQRMAAVLHDVLDESCVTLADLVEEGFPAEVIEAIRVLAKVEGEGLTDGAERAAQNPIARMVKLSDVGVHMMEIINEDPQGRTKTRIYEHARAILMSHEGNAA